MHFNQRDRSCFLFSAMYSRLIVKFNAKEFKVMKKMDSLSLIDFCVKVGGIVNLFLGASLISFIELLYFVTIRLYFQQRQSHIHS